MRGVRSSFPLHAWQVSSLLLARFINPTIRLCVCTLSSSLSLSHFERARALSPLLSPSFFLPLPPSPLWSSQLFMSARIPVSCYLSAFCLFWLTRPRFVFLQCAHCWNAPNTRIRTYSTHVDECCRHSRDAQGWIFMRVSIHLSVYRTRKPLTFLAWQALADMRAPHTWFPLARQQRRKWVLHVGPTNSGKLKQLDIHMYMDLY